LGGFYYKNKMTYDVVLFTGFAEGTVKTFGAHKCAHELRRAGFRVLVVNHLHQFTLRELKEILTLAVGSNTLFVGFSNTFLQTSLQSVDPQVVKKPFENFLPLGLPAEQLFKFHLHSINPNCKIVVGGTRTFINVSNPYIDYAVIGYADLSVVNLARHLKYNDPLKKASRNLNKITIINDPVAEGFDFYNSSMSWTDDDVVVSGEQLLLEISRGCVFSCKFCNFRLNGKKNVDYLKKYENIRDELVYNFKNYNITHYRLLDDTYNDTEQKIDIMLDLVKSLPFKPVFWSYMRLDMLSKHPSTIEKIIDTGIVSMYFGIETLNKKAGTVIGKGYDPQAQIKTLQQMKQTYGDQIFLTGSFICGLPTESQASIQDSMEKLISGEVPLDAVIYRPLQISKNEYETWQSAFGLDMTKYGYHEIPWTDGNEIVQDVNWKTDIMTFEEARNICSEFHDRYNAIRPARANPIKVSSVDIIQYKQQLFAHLGIDQ